jgi:hypothetical protein
MKIRIINQNGLLVPQFQKKGYYGGNNWTCFGSPSIKFLEKDKQKAISFVKLVEESVQGKQVKKNNEIVYSNFAPEGKI